MQEKLEKICVTVLISVWRRFVKVRLWKTSASRKFTVDVPNERFLSLPSACRSLAVGLQD